MTKQGIARKTEAGEGEIVTRLGRGAYRIASFTDPGTFYEVNPYEGTCTCRRYEFTERCVKHVCLAESVLAARTLRFGAAIAEARVTELCLRLFAPVGKRESFTSSYRLLLDVLASRHSTEKMVEAAVRRHGRILLLHENSSGKVA